MIRSSTSPIFSPLLLYTALSRICFLALQPTARTFCSSTVTPIVVDPATCPRAVPPTSAHITLAITATTRCCCIASPFGLVDCTEQRCGMAVPPGNLLGWRRSIGGVSPITPSALPAKVARLYSEKMGKTNGLESHREPRHPPPVLCSCCYTTDWTIGIISSHRWNRA